MSAKWVGLALALLVGCGADPEPVPEPVPERITGVVTEVRPASGPVESFSVRTSDQKYDVSIDPARDYGFDLRHLEEHRDTGDPVVVELEQREGKLSAVSIVDA